MGQNEEYLAHEYPQPHCEELAYRRHRAVAASKLVRFRLSIYFNWCIPSLTLTVLQREFLALHPRSTFSRNRVGHQDQLWWLPRVLDLRWAPATPAGAGAGLAPEGGGAGWCIAQISLWTLRPTGSRPAWMRPSTFPCWTPGRLLGPGALRVILIQHKISTHPSPG